MLSVLQMLLSSVLVVTVRQLVVIIVQVLLLLLVGVVLLGMLSLILSRVLVLHWMLVLCWMLVLWWMLVLGRVRTRAVRYIEVRLGVEMGRLLARKVIVEELGLLVSGQVMTRLVGNPWSVISCEESQVRELSKRTKSEKLVIELSQSAK